MPSTPLPESDLHSVLQEGQSLQYADLGYSHKTFIQIAHLP